jgi:hypothetical protein
MFEHGRASAYLHCDSGLRFRSTYKALGEWGNAAEGAFGLDYAIAVVFAAIFVATVICATYFDGVALRIGIHRRARH